MEDRIKLLRELHSLIRQIQDVSIFGFVMKMLDVAPQSFWERASASKHHLEDERSKYGNLLHTIRVVKLTIVLCDVTNLPQLKRDILVASAVLHDMCKYGVHDEFEYTHKDHPSFVRKRAKEHSLFCPYDDPIFKIIEAHMGRWGTPPVTPTIDSRYLLHIADATIAHLGDVM